MVKNNVVLRKNPNIVTRVIDSEVILMPIYKNSDEINCIYTLNKVGTFIWSLINGKHNLSEMKKILLKKYDTTTEEVEVGLNNFLNDLSKIKAIK